MAPGVSMLSRLWRWTRPKSEWVEPAQVASAPAPIVESTRVARSVGADNDQHTPAPSFFDELKLEQPPSLLLDEADEPALSALVLQVVAYITERKVEPPVMPVLVPRVLQIVAEPEVDLVKLTHVIQQDVAISAKLLSVANSPMFGSSSEVKSVRQAIAFLGTEQVAQVAVGLACRSSFEADKRAASPLQARYQRLYRHAMTCAFAAAQLAGSSDREAQEAAFLGGLFHDVGKAVALRAVEALHTSGQLGALHEALLDEALQRIHAYPGDELYDKWTLPASLMELIAGHHQLDDLVLSNKAFYRVTLSSSFDALLHGSFAERRAALHEARISAAHLNLDEPALRAAYKQTRELSERMASMFSPGRSSGM
jgi:putative nucleotidyltransferase with HDIG domain